MTNFWKSLKKPIIGLSPMDGITDAAMRYIYAKIAKPDVIFTEQTSVEAMVCAPEKVKQRLSFTKIEHPIVAQLTGYNSEYFYEAAQYVLKLGFDGIDINLGCPRETENKHGQKRGAGLIGEYELVEKIVLSCRDAINLSRALSRDRVSSGKREQGLSVKTRLAENSPKTKKWISFLSQLPLDAITLHSRTLKQGYSGQAEWGEIGRMAKIAHQNGKIFLGNGDVKSRKDGEEKCKNYRCDGVLIGRAALGNPWSFGKMSFPPRIRVRGKLQWESTSSRQRLNQAQYDKVDRLSIMLEHAHYFDQIRGDMPFLTFRKHIGWYLRCFNDAKSLRIKLMSVRTLNELEKNLEEMDFEAKK